MIEKFFHTARAPFIVVRDGRMHIGDQTYQQLTVRIHEVTPVRKLFIAGALACYSLDCRTARNGRLCELCKDRHRCSRRLQLRLAYLDSHQQKPAILELHRNWFAAFDNLLQAIGTIDDLSQIPLIIKPVKNNGRTDLEFRRLDQPERSSP